MMLAGRSVSSCPLSSVLCSTENPIVTRLAPRYDGAGTEKRQNWGYTERVGRGCQHQPAEFSLPSARRGFGRVRRLIRHPDPTTLGVNREGREPHFPKVVAHAL